MGLGGLSSSNSCARDNAHWYTFSTAYQATDHVFGPVFKVFWHHLMQGIDFFPSWIGFFLVIWHPILSNLSFVHVLALFMGLVLTIKCCSFNMGRRIYCIELVVMCCPRSGMDRDRVHPAMKQVEGEDRPDEVKWRIGCLGKAVYLNQGFKYLNKYK